jgi:AraC-like DNA-binding protein
MSAIFAYSMKNFAQEIDLNQIAAIAFMTPNSFCRYFKQRTNITYFQFLIKILIEHACTLLSSLSDIAVAEIAKRSGFKNISNFNRQFKSIKKLSPLEYKSIDQV